MHSCHQVSVITAGFSPLRSFDAVLGVGPIAAVFFVVRADDPAHPQHGSDSSQKRKHPNRNAINGRAR